MMFQNFNLNEVKLTDGHFARRRDLSKRYVAGFDVNRLMHTFRVNAALPSDAEPLGGWEDPECGLRGHFVGHFLSACSKFAFADGDEALKAKAAEIVDILVSCAKPNGYLSAFEEEKLDALEAEEDRGAWAPYYTLHKILQGLIDCHSYLGNQKALALAVGLAHYIHGRFSKLSDWKIDGILRCTKVNPTNEFGGIGDALYSLYDITKDEKVLKLANLFDRDYFLGNLAAGKDVLENLHSNTHLPMILAAMHRYNLTGEEKYRTAALNFYRYLLGRTFVNGNSSSKATAYIKGGTSEKSEHWGGCGLLADALTGGESESCCAHNTEKVLQQLFAWTGDAGLLDHMETLKYNAVLNSASHRTGLSQYHQPMGSCVSKKFSGFYDTFWCCTASGVEAMSEVQKNIWFKGSGSLLLNLFIPSVVAWAEKGVTITQSSAFPDSLTATLTVRAQKPAEFSLVLREAAVESVLVNSQPAGWTREHGYIVVRHVFEDGDTVEIGIRAKLSVAPLQGCCDRAAVLYGNVALATLGDNPNLGKLTNENVGEKLTRTKDPELTFESKTGVRLIPLYRVEDEVYSVYLNLDESITVEKFTFAKDGSGAYES